MSQPRTHADVFVRDEMIPQSPPPVRQAGAVNWLRENLFSGPINSLLTLVGIAIIWWLVDHFWDWFAHSVWAANSLAECREIIAATWGEGARGACFAVIRERWHQYIFGFYPPELYWRPVLAFGLLFVAIAPVLLSESPRARRTILVVASLITLILMLVLNTPVPAFIAALIITVGATLTSERHPKKLLIFTLLYPLLGVWLIWGGSFWLPVMVLVGPLLCWACWKLFRRIAPLPAVAAGIALMLVWWLWFAGDAANDLNNLVPLGIASVKSSDIGGFLLAVTIGVAGITMSLPIGIILALSRRSDMPLIKWLAIVFIEFIRGVPLIALLFVAQLLLNYFLPPGTSFDIVLRVIIMVTLFASAYIAEVIRGGLAALPRGQYEAADALGLDYWQAQRLIILPQALKISIPGIVSSFISMFKDTTLVIFVGLYEPLKGISDFVRANFEWKGIYWEPFIFSGAIFFIICFSMSRYSMYLERRLRRDNK